jgi:hypothetical protein
MNSQEAYIAVYQTTRQYQIQTGNDDIAKMLSDIEPWPYKDKQGHEHFGSADPAVFDDEWTDAWNAIVGSGKNGSPNQIVRVANRLLEYYSNSLEYNLDGLVVALRRGLKDEQASKPMPANLKKAIV